METKVEQPITDLVAVTVNGVERKYPKGRNLLAALLDDGTQVPHYCWHPSLSIAGNCRLCMVEIEGQPRPSVSCNMSCTDGLKIKTEGPMVEDCRKGMMEFLLVNHPLDCPICDRGGECMLQRYSMEHGTGHARTIDERRRFEKPQFDPLIDIERNRCIMCTRCVRFMDEVAGEHVLAVVNRGNRNYIGTFGNGPVDSNFSGNIIDLCPVGCLTSKPFRFTARAWELQQVASTCTLCSAGCPTTAWIRDGKVMRVTPPARRYNGEWTIDEDTEKFICNEGRFGNYYPNHPDRLLKALVRKGEGLEAVELPDAIAAAALALRQAASAGPDKVAVLGGSRATNEEFYLLSRLARAALGTNQIDWRMECVSDAAARALGQAIGASDGDLTQLDRKAYAATLVVGVDLLDDVPVVGLKIKEAARLRRTRLAVVDSRLDGWLSEQASASAVVPPASLASTLDLLALAGDKRRKIPDAVRGVHETITSGETGLLVLGVDTAGGALLPELLPAAFRLLEKLGPGWKFLPVFRGRNAKGAHASGAQSDRLPGGAINDDSSRNRLAEFWGTVKASAEAGPTAPEILRRAAEGKIQTLLLHRCDELVHHVQRGLIEKAIAATPNVIVIDAFPSWISERASVVLPGAVFFETEGSLVSVDGELQGLTCGAKAPGDAQEDWKLILALIDEVGEAGSVRSIRGSVAGPGAIFRELLASWKPSRLFNLEDLKLEGAGAESPQRPQSAFRKRTRPEFKIQPSERPIVAPVEKAEPAEETAGENLTLYWHTAIQGPDHLGARSREFDQLRPEAAIELSPADATGLGLAPGDRVKLSRCRVASCEVRVNPSLPEGIAFGAGNVLGLELGEADGLAEIEISKAEG